MVRHLILSVDYELFGNGSGDLRSCVIRPTEKILELADKYGALVTLFVDIAEFHSMKQCSEFREDVTLVYAQIQSAVMRGHDVQLHIHPQWIGANYSAGVWDLSLEKWRIADMDAAELSSVFNTYKRELEQVVHVVDPDYVCSVFRAGGWCIQPSVNVLKAMRSVGMKVDSTVAPGCKLNADNWFDFSGAPRKPFWLVDEDVCVESNKEGLIEIPILTIRSSYIKQLYLLIKSKLLRQAKFACGCEGSYESGSGFLKKISVLLSKLSNINYSMLDFSVSSFDEMVEMSTQEYCESLYSRVIPLVAISHSKNFTAVSSVEFEKFLAWSSLREDVVFSTYTYFLECESHGE